MRSCEATGSTISEITCNFITMKNPAKFLGFFLFLCAMPNNNLLLRFSERFFTPVIHTGRDPCQTGRPPMQTLETGCMAMPCSVTTVTRGRHRPESERSEAYRWGVYQQWGYKNGKNKDLCSKTFCNVLHTYFEIMIQHD
jgi:hypothetical protein